VRDQTFGKPGEKTFQELVTAMTEHHSPTPSEIVQRYKFHSRFRKPGERIATFVSELRSLAESCNFEGTLEDQIRDRLVCGVNDDQIQRRLLSEAKLTYKRALELAQGLEMAAKNVRELQTSSRMPSGPTPSDSTMGGVHRLRPASRKKVRDSACYRCGKAGHFAAKCQFKDAKCHNCGKMGHLRMVCRSKRTSPAAGSHDQQQRTVKHLEEEPSSEEEEYSLFQLETP